MPIMIAKKPASRSSFIPTLFTIPALIVLLGLGTWQLYRMQWKNELMHTIEEKIQSAPVSLPIADDAIQALQYRRVTTTGQFLNDKEMYLYQTYNGKPGYEVMTPFLRDDGPVVLVDRGWVPMDKRDPETRKATQPKDPLTIEGMAHPSETPGTFTPDNNPDHNVWFYIDMPQMAKYIGMDVQPMYVRMVGSYVPGEYPIKGKITIDIRNDHLEYAITWYALAFALCIIYVLYIKRRGNP